MLVGKRGKDPCSSDTCLICNSSICLVHSFIPTLNPKPRNYSQPSTEHSEGRRLVSGLLACGFPDGGSGILLKQGNMRPLGYRVLFGSQRGPKFDMLAFYSTFSATNTCVREILFRMPWLNAPFFRQAKPLLQPSSFASLNCPSSLIPTVQSHGQLRA